MTEQNRAQKQDLKFVLEKVKKLISRGETDLKNRELIEICGEYGNFRNGAADPHFCHEIAEAAFNLLIKENYAATALKSQNQQEFCLLIKQLARRLPTQTWRSAEQNALQQFSTPPAIAYLLVFLLNLQLGVQVLEPSAGTGCLAVWGSGLGLKIHINEIDARRRELLNVLDFTPTARNAEFLDDFLAPDIRADCVLMNPPFSASGGRTANNSSKFGFRHVESALQRLEPCGKFGIILGEAAELRTKTGNELWQKMSGKISVKAIIKLAGREYYKNGTSVDVNLIVGTKRLAEQTISWQAERSRIVSAAATSVEEVFSLAEKLNLRLE